MHTIKERLIMGEIVRRDEEEQHEVEDSVLALTEAGWSQRDIAAELNISRKSIQPYRERALSRITIPDHDQAVRENIIQLQYVMDECKRRLSDKDMPITATNVPNLLHQFTRARAELNKVLEVGNKNKVELGIDGTLAQIWLNHQNELFGADGLPLPPDEEIVDAEIVEDDAYEDSVKNDA